MKSTLTEENRLLHKSYSAEVWKREQLEAKSVRDDDKIINLKRHNNQLLVDLLQERRASNLIIDKAMVEAHRLSGEALEMMFKANKMRANVDERIITDRNRASAALHQERALHPTELERSRKKHATSIENLLQEQASLVKVVQSKSDVKYHKVREDVSNFSKKLKEQRLI